LQGYYDVFGVNYYLKPMLQKFQEIHRNDPSTRTPLVVTVLLCPKGSQYMVRNHRAQGGQCPTILFEDIFNMHLEENSNFLFFFKKIFY
jgi:hypothetical protein